MTHLLTGANDNEVAACGAEGVSLAANIDYVDCHECIDVWDDWCELSNWDRDAAERNDGARHVTNGTN